MKDYALIHSLCKDIARHASQLEAEGQGVEQSVDRYCELKNLLLTHCTQGENNFDIILKEIRKSTQYAGGKDNKGDITVSAKNHILCMLDYFLILYKEMNKEEM